MNYGTSSSSSHILYAAAATAVFIYSIHLCSLHIVSKISILTGLLNKVKRANARPRESERENVLVVCTQLRSMKMVLCHFGISIYGLCVCADVLCAFFAVHFEIRIVSCI